MPFKSERHAETSRIAHRGGSEAGARHRLQQFLQ
jgi:hypothetical protein